MAVYVCGLNYFNNKHLIFCFCGCCIYHWVPVCLMWPHAKLGCSFMVNFGLESGVVLIFHKKAGKKRKHKKDSVALLPNMLEF